MKAIDFFYYFIVFCALIGAGLWMLTESNYVFGTIVSVTAFYHAYRSLKENEKR